MRYLAAFGFWLGLACSAFAADNAIILTPGTGVTEASKDIGAGVQAPRVNVIDATGNNCFAAAGASSTCVLGVQGVSGGVAVPVSIATLPSGAVTNAGTFATQSTLAAETTKVIGTVNQGTSPWVVSGAVTNAGTFAAQLTGATNNINNIAGTISLPTGASTSALQTTGNTALSTINTTLGTPFQAGAALAANQSVNVAQIAGVATPVGSGVMATAPRMTLATDSPGIVNLGGATPANSVPTVSAGYTYAHIAAGQATTVIKSSAGVLHSISYNSAATATNTTNVYDNATGSGTVIATPAATVSTIAGQSTIYDVAFLTGLTIITATANGADMTVSYR